jgi:proteic killer suppression protein
MIASFCNQGTEDIFQRVESRESRQVLPSTLHHIAARKLAMLNAARFVDDLRIPPGNRLEKLKGTLDGYFSIRINDQWRIIFRWSENTAQDVRISDYHS